MKSILSKAKGITLIALVITIIIIIILAGVAINLSIGENGIFNKSKQAKEEYQKSAATEEMNLKITTCQIQSYTESGKLPDLQYLADRFCEDNDIAYVNLEKQKVGAINDKISIGENTSIFTKLEKYPYEFEINNKLQLASIDGIQVASIPQNNDDTIISMTKSELTRFISDEISSKLSDYSTSSQIEQSITDSISFKKYMMNNNGYVTGTTSIDLTSLQYNELYVVCKAYKNPFNMIYSFNILKSDLSSTENYYTSGQDNGAGNNYCQISCTTSNLFLRGFYISGTDYTASTNIIIYYR